MFFWPPVFAEFDLTKFCCFNFYSCQLYPFVVLMAGVLTWYQMLALNHWRVNEFYWTLDPYVVIIWGVMQGLFVSVRYNGEISTFSYFGNWTCIWFPRGKPLIFSVNVSMPKNFYNHIRQVFNLPSEMYN